MYACGDVARRPEGITCDKDVTHVEAGPRIFFKGRLMQARPACVNASHWWFGGEELLACDEAKLTAQCGDPTTRFSSNNPDERGSLRFSEPAARARCRCGELL